MKLTIESTDTLLAIDGVPVRLWRGLTDRGIVCNVYVHLVQVRNDLTALAFDLALEEILKRPRMADLPEVLPRAGQAVSGPGNAPP